MVFTLSSPIFVGFVFPVQKGGDFVVAREERVSFVLLLFLWGVESLKNLVCT